MWELIVGIAGWSASAVLAISYLPQIFGLIKGKNADGISLSFWFILDISLTLLFILALDSYLNTGSVSLLIAQSLNLGLALINTVLVVHYKKRG